MRALVYSIPGSGTRFTIEYLTKALGFKQADMHELLDMPEDAHAFALLHVKREGGVSQELLRVAAPLLRVVVPMRSPVAVTITRGGDVEVAKQFWATLRRTIDEWDHVILPVESPWFDHGRLLRVVAEHVGAEPDVKPHNDIARRWPKVGAHSDHKARDDYDRTGRTPWSASLDEETAWYIERLAMFAEGAYRR